MRLMAYDEHYNTGKAGPIASLNWSSKSLNLPDIPPNKLIGGVGDYGYDWTVNSKKPAEDISYSDIIDDVGFDNSICLAVIS